MRKADETPAGSSANFLGTGRRDAVVVVVVAVVAVVVVDSLYVQRFRCFEQFIVEVAIVEEGAKDGVEESKVEGNKEKEDVE